MIRFTALLGFLLCLVGSSKACGPFLGVERIGTFRLKLGSAELAFVGAPVNSRWTNKEAGEGVTTVAVLKVLKRHAALDGKKVVDVFALAVDVAALDAVGGHLEVLVDGHQREIAAALRHVAETIGADSTTLVLDHAVTGLAQGYGVMDADPAKRDNPMDLTRLDCATFETSDIVHRLRLDPDLSSGARTNGRLCQLTFARQNVSDERNLE
jgi:hypothetical protein